MRILNKSFWFIWKKGYKTIIKKKAKVLPVLLIMIFALGFASSMFYIQNSRTMIIIEAINNSNYPDAKLDLNPVPIQTVKRAFRNPSLDYFEFYEPRLINRIDFEINGTKFDGILIGIDTSLQRHLFQLVDEEKSPLETVDHCLNWNFANVQGIQINDVIMLKLGSKEDTVRVKNIGFCAEFLLAPLDQDLLFPSTEPFPIFYVDISYMSSFFLNSSTTIANQALFNYKKNIPRDIIEDYLTEELGENFKTITYKEDFNLIKTLREGATSDEQMMATFPVVMIIGSMLTLIIIIHRLIESDLESVSIFQGLGATKLEITGSYIVFNIILSTISQIIGSIFGYLIGSYTARSLIDLMGVPFYVVIPFSFENFIYFGFLLFSISTVSTLLILKKSFNLDVQEAMKQGTKFLRKKGLIEILTVKIKKNLHPFMKYSLRRVFGRKIFMVFIILALVVSSLFLVFVYGVMDSIKFTLERKVEVIEKWDGYGTTTHYKSISVLKNNFSQLNCIDQFEFGIADTVKFSLNNENFDEYLKLAAYAPNSELHLLIVDQGHNMTNDYEILVSKDVLQEFSLNLSDTIYIRNVFSNSTRQFTIVGTVNDLTQRTIYTTLNMAQMIMKAPNRVNIIYFTIQGNAETAADMVQDLEYIQDVKMKNDIVDTLNNTLELFSYVTFIFGFMFILFGLAIIGIIVKNLIDYRMEDYAYMKSLGLYDLEIKASLLIEIMLYLMISLPLGFYLGIVLTDYLIGYFSFLMPGLVFYIYPISYFYFGMEIFLMILFVLVWQFRRLKFLNLAELTKTKTFG